MSKAPIGPAPSNSPATTTELIAYLWDSLDWSRTLQAALIIVAVGFTAALVLAGVELAARTVTSQAAAWSVSITITATVSYKTALRRR